MNDHKTRDTANEILRAGLLYSRIYLPSSIVTFTDIFIVGAVRNYHEDLKILRNGLFSQGYFGDDETQAGYVCPTEQVNGVMGT